MRSSLEQFHSQFLFTPVVSNKERLRTYSRFCVCGMGGSNLSPGLLLAWKPEMDIRQHRDYGLPEGLSKQDMLVVVSSFSGNTEEALSSFDEAHAKGYDVAVITSGGALLDRARDAEVPVVQIPSGDGIEPRIAIGYSFVALVALVGDEQMQREVAALAGALSDIGSFEAKGKEIAERILGYVPVLYASRRNSAVAYVWKINLNETGKIPAFTHAFPEMDHNELNGYGEIGEDGTRNVFLPVLLQDAEDHERNQLRFDITNNVMREQGMRTLILPFDGDSRLGRVFSSILRAYWTAYYVALGEHHEPGGQPLVDELKMRLAE